MIIELLKKELEHVSHKIYNRRMVAATGGNISVRIPGTDHVLIKRTAISLGEVTAQDVLLVNLDGEVIEGYGTPSKEAGFHLGIYKIRQDVNAVVHCHPPYAVGFANLGLELPTLTVTAQKVLGYVPIAKVAPAGSVELRENVLDVFRKHPDLKVALLERHGICAVGASLEAAYNIADLTEQTAQEDFVTMLIKNNLNTLPLV